MVISGKLFTGSFGNAGALGPLPVYGASGPARQLVDVASLGGLERRLVRLGLPAGVIWENADHWDVHADIIEDWLNDIIPVTAYAVKSAISIIDFPASSSMVRCLVRSWTKLYLVFQRLWILKSHRV